MSRFDIVQLDNDTWAVIDDQLPPPLYISAHRSREWAQAALAQERLIDAAPDLLVALKALFADYKALADSGDCGNWRIEDEDVGKQALAAIAKAEGNVK